MQTQRVVVTGIGIWSCLGTDVQSVTASLRAGRSGIGVDPERAAYGYQSTLTGIVERPVLKGLLDRRMRTGLAEEGEYPYMAARQALQMAQLDDEQLREREVGCIFGNDSSAAPVIEAAEIMREKHDSASRQRFHLPVHEFDRHDEPQHHFRPARRQLHRERSLRQR